MLKVNGQSNLQDVSVNNIIHCSGINGQVHIPNDLSVNDFIISPKFRALKPVNNVTNIFPSINSPMFATIANDISCNGGTLIFIIKTSGSSGTSGLRQYKIQMLDNNNNIVATMDCNHVFLTNNIHNHNWSNTHVQEGVPAGNYKINVIRNNSSLIHNTGDFLNVTILEMPY